MSIKMAQQYEAAWHKLYYDLPRWKQESIIADPHGRIADDLAHDSAIMAETSNKPILVTSGTNG